MATVSKKTVYKYGVKGLIVKAVELLLTFPKIVSFRTS